jgi:hypothetical protein
VTGAVTTAIPAGRAITDALQVEGITTVFGIILDTGARINYMDTMSAIGGMLELVELTQAQLGRYTLFYVSSVGWDGTDPVREG